MAKTLTGLSGNTLKNMQLDAGVFVKNMTNPASGDLTNAKILGATTGGSTFTATPEIRNLFDDVDGARGAYKEGDVIDNWDISFTTTLVELTADNIALALASSTISDNTSGGKTISPGMIIEANDYIDNICWCGTVKGSLKPIVIEMRNVLNTNGLTLTITDKGKGTVELELRPRFTVTDIDDVPFDIHYPSIA